jgi:hypothetical protein
MCPSTGPIGDWWIPDGAAVLQQLGVVQRQCGQIVGEDALELAPDTIRTGRRYSLPSLGCAPAGAIHRLSHTLGKMKHLRRDTRGASLGLGMECFALLVIEVVVSVLHASTISTSGPHE